MLQIKIGLVDTTGAIDPKLVAAAANALNVQVTRDLTQFWPINATVGFLPDPSHIPQGVWPVQLVAHLPPPEGGFHLTKHNQPFAKVIATPNSNDWTIDASHETLEMLVDPAGNRLQTSRSIQIVGDKIVDGPDQFEYLVELCDPCEDNSFSYQVGDISVSDFITPNFYEPEALPDHRYSFTGAIKAPRQILQNGYISWIDPKSDRIQQIQNFGQPKLIDLGPANGASLRLQVDGLTRTKVPDTDKTREEYKTKAQREHAFSELISANARARAKHYK